MAAKITKIYESRMNVPEPEYLPATASEAFAEGEFLKFTSGKLTKASGTDVPTHICGKTQAASASPADLPAFPISKNQVIEVPVTFSGTPNALVLGSKVTIATDGKGVTDVVTNGVATIVDKLSAVSTTGDKVLVMFK